MPSTPGFHVVRNIPEAVFILDQDQRLYRSGVGMLLFLENTHDQIYPIILVNYQR